MPRKSCSGTRKSEQSPYRRTEIPERTVHRAKKLRFNIRVTSEHIFDYIDYIQFHVSRVYIEKYSSSVQMKYSTPVILQDQITVHIYSPNVPFTTSKYKIKTFTKQSTDNVQEKRHCLYDDKSKYIQIHVIVNASPLFKFDCIIDCNS